MEKECGFKKHRVPKSQQINMSVLNVYYFNTACPTGYHHNCLWQLVHLGTPMYDYIHNFTHPHP